MLLLTFSRQATEELTRRVARLASASPRCAPAVLAWYGTFHSVGARLLREYAQWIGLAPGFTIHDREDAADLNLVRYELGCSAKAKRFPMKGTCLAVYSAVVNTQGDLASVLRSAFPWWVQWEADLKRLFLAYVQAKQAHQVLDYDDLLLYWAQALENPRHSWAARTGRTRNPESLWPSAWIPGSATRPRNDESVADHEAR